MSTIPFDADTMTAQPVRLRPPEPISFNAWYKSLPVQQKLAQAVNGESRTVILTELRRTKQALIGVFMMRVSPSLVSPLDKFVEIPIPDHVMIPAGNLRQCVIR